MPYRIKELRWFPEQATVLSDIKTPEKHDR